MALVAFDPSEVEGFYEHYYQQQEGNGLAVFRRKRIMDGNGLGSILGGSFFALLLQLLKNFAKSAAKELRKPDSQRCERHFYAERMPDKVL